MIVYKFLKYFYKKLYKYIFLHEILDFILTLQMMYTQKFSTPSVKIKFNILLAVIIFLNNWWK